MILFNKYVQHPSVMPFFSKSGNEIVKEYLFFVFSLFHIENQCQLKIWLWVSFARVLARSIDRTHSFPIILLFPSMVHHLCFGNNMSFQHPIVTKVVWWHGGLRGYCFLNGVPHAPSNYIYCQQTEDRIWWNNWTRYLEKIGIWLDLASNYF